VKSSSGMTVAGIIGGAISSTAVSFSFSRLSKSAQNGSVALAAGVVGACTVLFIRVTIAATVLNPSLARAALPLFALPFALGAALTAAGLWANSKSEAPPNQPEDPDRQNPLQFWTSLKIAAVFQGVFYLVHALTAVWGNKGILVSGAIVGFTDVDALVLSMSRGGNGTDLGAAPLALTIGILSNTVLKLGVVLILGKGRFRWLATGGLLLITAALVASVFFFSF
jgi:uncharacterized membrane protein (DUF4010 family)